MSYDLRGEYQRQLVLDQYNAMYNTASTQDPRLKELMDMLSKLLFSQPVSSLSPGWQTGFDYLSRAVVNSPLAPTLGIHNQGNMFADYHAAILQQGGLPMMNAAGNVGMSYGVGANTLSLAQHMQRQTNTMAMQSGLDPQLVAGFMAARIQQNGFQQGDIMSFGDSSTRTSADIFRLYQESKGMATPETQKAMLQQTLTNKALEIYTATKLGGEYGEYYGKKYEEIVSDPLGAALARKAMTDFAKIDDVHKEDLLREAKVQYGGIKEIQDLNIYEIGSGHMEQAVAANAHGLTYTTTTSKYEQDSQNALHKHANNIKELSKIFDTKNFAELDNITKTLQMGSLENERTVQRMRERIDGAKRTALVTNRDVKEVLAEQSSIMDVLGMGAGGKHLVAGAEVQRSQIALEAFRRNQRLGYETRSESEFLTDLATGAADDRQHFMGARMAELALSDKYAKGLTADQQSTIRALQAEYLSPGTSRERQKAISAQLQETITGLGGVYAAQAFQNEAAKLTSDGLLASENRGLMVHNADSLLTGLNSTLGLNDAQLAKGSSALAGYFEAFGNDHAAGKYLQDMLGKGMSKDDILSYYRQKGVTDSTLDKIGNWIDFRGSVSKHQGNVLDVNMAHLATRAQAMDSAVNNDIAAKAEADEWHMKKSGAFENVDFAGGNFLAGFLGETGEITDEAVLLNIMANRGVDSKVEKYRLGKFKDGKFVGSNDDISVEERKLLGLAADADLSKMNSTEWAQALMQAEKNGFVVAQDAEGNMSMARNDKRFAKERERYAKMSKGLNPLYSVIKDISGLEISEEGGKRVFKKDGKEITEDAFLDEVHDQLESSPEARAKYEAALKQSGDPDAKVWDKKIKLSDYAEDLTLTEKEWRKGKQFRQRVVDKNGKIKSDSAYYKMYKKIFDKGKELYKGNSDIMKKGDVGELLQHMLQNDPEEAIKLLEEGAFMESNLIAGKSKDQLKAEGLLDDDDKFTGKAGNLSGVKLTKEMLQFSQNSLKARSSEEAGSANESLITDILGCFKQLLGCVSGDYIKVDII